MAALTPYEQTALARLAETLKQGLWTEAGAIELIETVGDHLGLKTTIDYSKECNLTYGEILRTTNNRKILNVLFVLGKSQSGQMKLDLDNT
jgi:hypothetical protein